MVPPADDVSSSRESSTSYTNASNSSAANGSHVRSTQTGNTVKAKKSKAGEPTYGALLDQRFVEKDSSHDKLLDQSSLFQQLGSPASNLDFESFQSYFTLFRQHYLDMEKLIQRAHNNSHSFSSLAAFSLYELSLDELQEWRPPTAEHRTWPGITDRRFNCDQLHCRESNEADFQRTSLISLIDHYDFRQHFTFICEEQWNVGDYPLPSTMNNTMPQPKPDVMLCFRGETIEPKKAYRARFSKHLIPCLYPGKRDFTKMIPFFFIEAKKGDASLKSAFERNLNSASQALFNIWQLMKIYPEHTTEFFTAVRVFSLEVNVSTIILRVHRAEPNLESSELLEYKFCELQKIPDYQRLEGCHLVKTVLLEYALKTLLPIVKIVFSKISNNLPSKPSTPVATQEMKRKRLDGNPGPATPAVGPVAAEVQLPAADDNDDGGGSQTPRLMNAATGMTDSFTSNLDLEEIRDDIGAQHQPKRTRGTGPVTRKRRGK